jgi:nicotinamidase-related amidase
MDRSTAVSIPESLEEICATSRAALLVYDMQAGIVSQLADGGAIVERVGMLIRSARAAGMRVVYSRHYNVPLAWAGVGQARMGKTWQRARQASELKAVLQLGSPAVQIVEALAPPTDLGFIPVLVQDACGSGHAEAGERSLAALRYSGDTVLTDLASVVRALQPATGGG